MTITSPPTRSGIWPMLAREDPTVRAVAATDPGTWTAIAEAAAGMPTDTHDAAHAAATAAGPPSSGWCRWVPKNPRRVASLLAPNRPMASTLLL